MRFITSLFTLFLLIIVISVSACRPPELEQAVIDYNGGRYDNAYAEVLSATEKYPDNEEAWYYLGEIQGKKGNIKEMMESFNNSLTLKNTFQAEIQLAKSNYFAKYYNDGVSSYNAILQIEDKKSEEALKRLDQIITDFTNVNYINNDYMANRLISMAYRFKEDDENSLKYLYAAAEANPDTVLAYLDLGYYFQRKQEYLKAAEQFKKGIEVDPKDEECLIRYAESLDMAEKKDEAVAAYKAAFEVTPNEKAIPFNLGLLLFKQANAIEGDEAKKKSTMEEAIFYFEKAKELDPEIKEIYDLLGTLLLQLEQYEKAKEVLEQGVELFPDSSTVWQNLSFLYAKLGDKKKAEEAFEKSKQLQGD
jgi:tetratricopeptide (TPR) repeat protein